MKCFKIIVQAVIRSAMKADCLFFCGMRNSLIFYFLHEP
jgi:hypothetical protein